MSNKYGVRVVSRNDESGVSAVLAASYPALMAAAYTPEFLASAVPLMTKAQPHLLTSGTYYVACAMASLNQHWCYRHQMWQTIQTMTVCSLWVRSLA